MSVALCLGSSKFRGMSRVREVRASVQIALDCYKSGDLVAGWLGFLLMLIRILDAEYSTVGAFTSSHGIMQAASEPAPPPMPPQQIGCHVMPGMGIGRRRTRLQGLVEALVMQPQTPLVGHSRSSFLLEKTGRISVDLRQDRRRDAMDSVAIFCSTG